MFRCEVFMPALVRMSAALAVVLCFVQGQELVKSGIPSKMTALPKAKIETVVDDYHGHKIADPYRWLENSASPETQRFVEEQNAYTRQVLDGIAGRDKLRARLEQLVSIGRVESPNVCGHYYFYARLEGYLTTPNYYICECFSGTA